MDDDAVQAALATVCAYVQRECRDGVLVQLRKQRQAANQRALVARRKTEQLQLEVAFLRILNRCLLYQVRQYIGYRVGGMSETPEVPISGDGGTQFG